MSEFNCEQCKDEVLRKISEMKVDFKAQIDELKAITTKRLDAHSGEITELTKITERLTTLLEIREKEKDQNKTGWIMPIGVAVIVATLTALFSKIFK